MVVADQNLVLLDTNKLKSRLRHSLAILEALEEVSSTNDYLKPFSKNNKEVVACFAETQTAGKGRLNRQWHSPFSEKILKVEC